MSSKKCTSVTTTRERDECDVADVARPAKATRHRPEGKRALNSVARAAAPGRPRIFGDRFGYMLITNPFRKITTARGGEGGEEMVVILEGNGLITQARGKEEGRYVHAMPCRGLITHFAAAFAGCTLHYLTSSSGNGSEGKIGADCGGAGRCRKARSQFRNQIGPPNDRLFARPSAPASVRTFCVEMWLVMFPNENGDWGERQDGRGTDFVARPK